MKNLDVVFIRLELGIHPVMRSPSPERAKSFENGREARVSACFRPQNKLVLERHKCRAPRRGHYRDLSLVASGCTVTRSKRINGSVRRVGQKPSSQPLVVSARALRRELLRKIVQFSPGNELHVAARAQSYSSDGLGKR